MIYILETDISAEKSIYVSLRKIYGLGKYKVIVLCKIIGLSPNMKTKKLSPKKLKKLIKVVNSLNITITSELKKQLSLNLKNLIEIKCYRGLRKLRGLPVRGQRTHTNAKNSKKFEFSTEFPSSSSSFYNVCQKICPYHEDIFDIGYHHPVAI